MQFTVDSIIAAAQKFLHWPSLNWGQRYQLKDSLGHGTDIYQTEEQLAAYLCWYGEMHKVKCLVAAQNFPFESLGLRIHIVDWGCGQALATLCFLEMLDQRGLLSYVHKVTLIEPSEAALNRANQNVQRALIGHSVTIECLNQKLPSKESPGDVLAVNLDSKCTVHLFSNILDLTKIDLRKTAELIVAGIGVHHVLCLGPCNLNKDRIDDFCNYFTGREEFCNVDDRRIAHTSDNYPVTCKARCFSIQTSHSHIDNANIEGQYSDAGAYDDYDTEALVRNGFLSEKLLRVYQHLSRNLYVGDQIYLKPEMGGDSPDIVIIRKWKGIIVMNVFEDDLADCQSDGGEFTCRGESIASPISVVAGYCDNFLTEKSTTLLRNAIQQKNGWYVIRPAVWFPDASREQVSSVFNTKKEKGKALLLSSEDFNRDVLDVLDLKHSRSCFTLEVYNEISQLLKSGWHSFRDGDQSLKLRKEQIPLAKSEEGKKQKIKGVAGSGKTQVLASRAVNCQLRTGGNILILTYNITLVNYIRYRVGQVPADFPWSKFTISNYHRFFASQARNHEVKMDKDGNCFDNMLFFGLVKEKLPKYSAILIDEAQDYKYSWLKLLESCFLADKGEFIVFGDAKQNIYKRELDDEKEIKTPIPGPWTNRLNEGQRFDNPRIASLAMSFQRYFFQSQEADIIQPQLEIGFASEREVQYSLFSVSESARSIAAECLQIIDSNHLEKHNTVILSQGDAFLRWVEQHIRKTVHSSCMTTFETQEVYDKLLSDRGGNPKDDLFKDDIKRVRNNKKLHFTMDSDLLKISSIHSYKGWDADNVILIIQSEGFIDEFGESSFMARPELIYTAITRAKQNLFVINLGNSLFDGFFKTALG
jgi:Superfamily I DNA and RNA helicases